MSLEKFNRKVSRRKDDYRHLPGAYDYDGLAHWWAYNYGHRTTAKGKMTADGNFLYSYTTVIASIMDPPKGKTEPLVLLERDPYSATTNTHCWAVASAVRHMNLIYVDRVRPITRDLHIENMEGFFSSMEANALAFIKARKDSTRATYAAAIIKNKETAVMYGEYFKVRNTKVYKRIIAFANPYKEDFLETIKVEFKKKLEKEKKLKKKAKEKREREEAEEVERNKERLEAWLSGESSLIPNRRFLEKVHIRIKDGYIETTGNAHIHIKDAWLAFKRYSKGTLKTNAHIGPYLFGGVDKDGIAHIGCHSIPLKDIEKLMSTVTPEDIKNKENT